MAGYWRYNLSDELGEYKQLRRGYSKPKLKEFGLHEQSYQEIYIKDLNSLVQEFSKNKVFTFDAFIELWDSHNFPFIFHGRQSVKEKKWFIQLVFRATVAAICNVARGDGQRFGAVFALYCLYKCQFPETDADLQKVMMVYGEMMSLARLCHTAELQGASDVVKCVYKMFLDDVVILTAYPKRVTGHVRYEYFVAGQFKDTKFKKENRDMQVALTEELMEDLEEDEGPSTAHAVPDASAQNFASQYHLGLLSKALSCYISKGLGRDTSTSVEGHDVVKQFINIGRKSEKGSLQMSDVNSFLEVERPEPDECEMMMSQRERRYRARLAALAPAEEDGGHTQAASTSTETVTNTKPPAMTDLKRKKLKLWQPGVDPSGDSDVK